MASVLMIVEDDLVPTAQDTAMRSRLEARGHTVTYRDDHDAADWNYDLLILTGQNATAAGAKYRDAPVPALVFSTYDWHELRMSMMAFTYTTADTTQFVTVEDAAHPLSGGLAIGSHRVYTEGTTTTRASILSSSAPAEAQRPVTTGSGRAVIFGYDTGATMWNGRIANARRVGFGLYTFTALNTAGLALFDAAIRWLLGAARRVASAQRPGTAPMPSPLPHYDRQNEAQFRSGVERALMDLTGAVTSTDSRLTDAREPTAHASTHVSGGSDQLTLASLVGNLPVARVTDAVSLTTLAAHEADTTSVHGIANTAALVLTGDSRLTDARTPTAHAASHCSGGTDALTLASLVGDLPVARVTGAVATTDPRLSDARTPVAHAASHAVGGTDALSLASFSLADLGTRDAAALTGTLPDARLTANVPLKDAINILTQPLVINRTATTNNALIARVGGVDSYLLTAKGRFVYQFVAGAGNTASWEEVASGKMGMTLGTHIRAPALEIGTTEVATSARAFQNLTSLAVGGIGSFGGATFGIYLANATTGFTSIPLNGGAFIVQAGALKYRGPSGTVTVLAPA